MPKAASYLPRRSKWRRTAIITVAAALVITPGVWYGLGRYLNEGPASQVPAAIREAAAFPIYLPEKTRYRLEADTLSYSSGVLLYKASDQANTFVVTQQAEPANFKLSEYKTGQGYDDAAELALPYGRALTGSVVNQRTAIVVAGGTLINVVQLSQGNSSSLDTFLRSLNQVTERE